MSDTTNNPAPATDRDRLATLTDTLTKETPMTNRVTINQDRAADLPDYDEALAGGSRGWRTPECGIVWSAPAGRVMIQRVEPGNWTPAEARDVAARILAAADYAEGGA